MSDLEDAMEILKEFYAKPRPRNEYELAIAEREVWMEYCRKLRNGGAGKAPRRSEWFGEHFEVTGYDVEMRSVILNSGDWTQPIWALISNLKLPLRTAKRLVTKAKDVAQHHELDKDEALKRVLTDYEGSQKDRYEAVSTTGATFLKKRPKASVSALGDDPLKIDADVGTSKQFIAVIEKLTRTFIDQRLGTVDSEFERIQIVTEFTMAVRVAYEELLKRINRSRARPKGEHDPIVVVTRQQIVNACEFLAMKPPKKNQPIDLELAKRQHRKLSAQLHPDRTGNDNRLTEQFKQIQEAMDIIRAYAENT